MQLKNSAAWILHPKSKLTVSKAPLPLCAPTELLVQVHYVAINPVDWKIQDSDPFHSTYPAILGEDLVGEVLEVGSKLTNQSKFEVGSRVIAYAQGLSLGTEYGAFQLYARVKSELACVIPDEITLEDAVVIPLSVSTAAAGLYLKKTLGLGYPKLEHMARPPAILDLWSAEKKEKEKTKTLLLWGGSSSVGSSVIQLASASGYSVITTASPANHEYCKSLGAAIVVDYHDPDIVPILTAILKDTQLVGAYDAIGSDTTVGQCADVLHALGGGTVATVSNAPEVWDDVAVVMIGAEHILSEDPEVAKMVWHKYLPKALERKDFVPAPKPLNVGKGLESVQGGLDTQKKGVSAKKVVVKL